MSTSPFTAATLLILAATVSRSTGTQGRATFTRYPHTVWDDDVIETAMKYFYNDDLSTMIDAIKLNITAEWSREEKHWEACHSLTKTCAERYAMESAQLACKAYEGVAQKSTLEDGYFMAALPIVQKRIAQGGVRLAAILNRIFSGNRRLQSN